MPQIAAKSSPGAELLEIIQMEPLGRFKNNHNGNAKGDFAFCSKFLYCGFWKILKIVRLWIKNLLSFSKTYKNNYRVKQTFEIENTYINNIVTIVFFSISIYLHLFFFQVRKTIFKSNNFH